jgi:hypothetical protein
MWGKKWGKSYLLHFVGSQEKGFSVRCLQWSKIQNFISFCAETAHATARFPPRVRPATLKLFVIG